MKQFAKSGYKKTTLDDIAGELDMTNANLYCYARSKQALYYDSVAYAMTKWQNKVHDAFKTESDPVKRLLALCDNAVLYLSEDHVFCQILKNDPDIFPMFPTVDPYEEINKRSIDMLCDTLKMGVDSGVFYDINTESSARVFFALYKTIIIEGYIQSEDDNFLEAYKDMREIILNGLVKK